MEMKNKMFAILKISAFLIESTKHNRKHIFVGYSCNKQILDKISI